MRIRDQYTWPHTSPSLTCQRPATTYNTQSQWRHAGQSLHLSYSSASSSLFVPSMIPNSNVSPIDPTTRSNRTRDTLRLALVDPDVRRFVSWRFIMNREMRMDDNLVKRWWGPFCQDPVWCEWQTVQWNWVLEKIHQEEHWAPVSKINELILTCGQLVGMHTGLILKASCSTFIDNMTLEKHTSCTIMNWKRRSLTWSITCRRVKANQRTLADCDSVHSLIKWLFCR